jgi:hypothetical protein
VAVEGDLGAKPFGLDLVYQCGECDSRYLGEQWCTDCTRPCRSLGAGGLCGHLGEPLTVAEPLAGEVVT